MSHKKEKYVSGICFICKKECYQAETIEDYIDWVYHVSVGHVHKYHPGIKEWYDNLMVKLNEQLKNILSEE